MNEAEKILASLHPLERAVLPVLKEGVNLQRLQEETKLQEVEIVRALQWMENKKIVVLKRDAKEIVVLDENGRLYLEKGLPEKRFLQVLETPLKLEEIKERAALDTNELHASFGLLKSRNAVNINDSLVSITDAGRSFFKSDDAEEFLRMLPLDVSKLNEKQRAIFEQLKRRQRILQTKLEKTVYVQMTDLGKRLATMDIKDDYLESLTPAVIRSKAWQHKEMRRYDVVINVPRIYPTKRHFVNQAIEYVKRIWLELGFTEMTGPMLDTCFWNFDALFVPQDHPAREMQDTFYIKGNGTLPDRKLVSAVKAAQEHGYTTGSTGWGYKWDPEKAKQLVLRTHTTALSARTLARLKPSDLPAKFFSVGRCFRNEAVDWKHLIEFDHAEGIVVGEGLTFRHLLGYLREFFTKMGFPDVRFRPSYFPYVEPGLECEVYHPARKQWIELGGAGILRPEVVAPLLGKNATVLAWGLGLGRLIMDRLGIKDLRDFHQNDLKQLQEMKVWADN